MKSSRMPVRDLRRWSERRSVQRAFEDQDAVTERAERAERERRLGSKGTGCLL